jgi:hypothetical protein
VHVVEASAGRTKTLRENVRLWAAVGSPRWAVGAPIWAGGCKQGGNLRTIRLFDFWPGCGRTQFGQRSFARGNSRSNARDVLLVYI